MYASACVGGLVLRNNRSIRLFKSDGSRLPASTAYEIGQVWDMDIESMDNLKPPHIEDVKVLRRELSGTREGLKEFLLDRLQPWRGGPDSIFDGLIRVTSTGKGYISETAGVPNASTGFWIPDYGLTRFDDESRQYRYENSFGSTNPHGLRYITYVGFQPPIDSIPSGSLVRLSLARWWRPEDSDPDFELRCYLQLSGWYL